MTPKAYKRSSNVFLARHITLLHQSAN